ncbi:hypothetical protein TEA_011230 [Camellia sinensis var. sinensis]|uniref:Uncharacterized protein n=1 Tax=Camellia sinensis var. sinensis TaxID=542762 RepID=A0A4S4DSA7_CAMSN|nr:hypothetical protein TEA_011230 [Camellia sinensis var. sinensis]
MVMFFHSTLVYPGTLASILLPSGVSNGDFYNERADNSADQPVLLNQTCEQSEVCCGENGICSHEVLRDGDPDSGLDVVQNRFMRKASFKLSWCGKGDNNDQRKHDIVSFEKGNITAAERSSKQISLKWESQPQTVLILTKPNSPSVRILCAEMVSMCLSSYRSSNGEEPIKGKSTIKVDIPDCGVAMWHWFSVVFSISGLLKVEAIEALWSVTSMIVPYKGNEDLYPPLSITMKLGKWLKDHKELNIVVEPRVRVELLTDSMNYNFVQTWKDDKEVLLLHEKVDLVVTLGGDGTVLWSILIHGDRRPWIDPPRSSPLRASTSPDWRRTLLPSNHLIGLLNSSSSSSSPVVPFSATLLFSNPTAMASIPNPNPSPAYVEAIEEIMKTYKSLLPRPTIEEAASMFKGPVPPLVPFSLDSEHYKETLDSILRGPVSITLRHRLQCHVIREAAKNEYETEEPILVLNEVTIDRGISSFLTNLECYCDNSFVTCVQGDGLILSTTSGSTAYSLAAGGSMVHPQVPGILFTPICPHSLSFRPLILPEHITLRVQVPFNSRSHAWASFDGKDRKMLAPGDALVCSMAPWPVATACQGDSTSDFLRSIHEGLHWNLRKTQSFDGPRDT